MAKIGFTKLGLKPNNEIKIIEFNGQNIEVKQYLPIEDKLELITNVINLSIDEDNNFANPIKIEVYTALEIIEKYTNINFTDKQKENPTKLYDAMNSNHFISLIISALSSTEYDAILNGIQKSIKAFDDYRNSIMNVLKNISTDYTNIDLDLSNIQEKINDPEALSTLKQLAEISGLVDNDNNKNEIE